MTVKPREPPQSGAAPIRAVSQHNEALNHASLRDEQSAIVALVDELAILAADLLIAGKLDGFSLQEEPEDDDDE
jgi:hypothetical protein